MMGVPIYLTHQKSINSKKQRGLLPSIDRGKPVGHLTLAREISSPEDVLHELGDRPVFGGVAANLSNLLNV